MTATMVTLDALLDAATALVLKSVETETVGLHDATGRTLAAPIHADRDLPPFNRAAMDGFALLHSAFEDRMTCVGRVDAGAAAPIHISTYTCVSIATGAAMPAGLDTVVPHELTSRDGDDVLFEKRPECCANVHPQAADAHRGDQLVPQGAILGPAEIGLAAACGVDQMAVRRLLTATICTTGDEVVSTTGTPTDHQIRNSNGPMVAAMLGQLGCTCATQHLADDLDATIAALGSIPSDVDMLITSGGISAGDRDFVPAALEALGVHWDVVHAAVQPGRPVRLGRLGSTIVVCLPGNPVSALVMGRVLLERITAALHDRPAPAWTPLPLGIDVQANPRRELLRPAVERDGAAYVPSWQGSGDLAHTAGMNAIVRLPMQSEVVPAGTRVPVLRT